MLEEYLGHCGPYSAFFDVISLNTPVSKENKAGSEASHELIDTVPSLSPSPEDEYLRKDLLSKIGKFVDGLPAHLKLVAMLHYWDGQSQAEIARKLDISQSAVSQRLSKVVASGRVHFGVRMH